MGPELWCPAFCVPTCVHIQAGPQPGINMSLRDRHHVSEGSSCICSSGSQKLCRHSAPETCRIAREQRLEYFWDKGRLRVMSQHHFAVVLCWFFWCANLQNGFCHRDLSCDYVHWLHVQRKRSLLLTLPFLICNCCSALHGKRLNEESS